MDDNPPDLKPAVFAKNFLAIHKGIKGAAAKTLKTSRDVAHPYWAAVLAALEVA